MNSMKNKKLYIVCGPAGSGKSTWIKSRLQPEDAYISRDEVRFSLVREDEDYFLKEKEVFRRFVDLINLNLSTTSCNSVYVDATHISPSSRKKLTNSLNINENIEIIFVSVYPDVETCVAQNNQRTGRARVPEDVIRAMHEKYIIPSTNEYQPNATAVILVD